jgi:hypothetical protein
LSELDPELFELAKRAVGHEHELTPEQSRRLIGADAKSLRADAARMRGELGMEPLPNPRDRDRDDQGRFVGASGTGKFDMNSFIREAAGR